MKKALVGFFLLCAGSAFAGFELDCRSQEEGPLQLKVKHTDAGETRLSWWSKGEDQNVVKGPKDADVRKTHRGIYVEWGKRVAKLRLTRVQGSQTEYNGSFHMEYAFKGSERHTVFPVECTYTYKPQVALYNLQ